MTTRHVYLCGGGTFSHVRSHLALAAPAFGKTIQDIVDILQTTPLEDFPEVSEGVEYQYKKRLTRMADPTSDIMTNDDVERVFEEIIADPQAKVVFVSYALCDYTGQIKGVPSGKYANRLHSRGGQQVSIDLTPAEKLIGKLRKTRKDLFVIGFKTTAGATEQEQYVAGLRLLKESSLNLVLANDVVHRRNMVVVPEEDRYHVTTNRKQALQGLVEMTLKRCNLTFHRTEVGGHGPTRKWDSSEVPSEFREVMNHCFQRGAYKPFRGTTVGHFCLRLNNPPPLLSLSLSSEGKYSENALWLLSSLRKHDHNETDTNGLILVAVDGDKLTSFSGKLKPSAGTRSQGQLLRDHPEMDFIVHFHCPLRGDCRDDIQVQNQRPYECGSLECGLNTSRGMKTFGKVKAVHLDHHGPNIMWARGTDPKEVIDFIEANWILPSKTGGPVQ